MHKTTPLDVLLSGLFEVFNTTYNGSNMIVTKQFATHEDNKENSTTEIDKVNNKVNTKQTGYAFKNKTGAYTLVTITNGDHYAYYDVDLDGNETTHRTQNTVADETYTVKEVMAPAGYKVNIDQVFNTGQEDSNMLFNVINNLSVEIQTPKKPYETGNAEFNPIWIITASGVILGAVVITGLSKKKKSIGD